MPPKRDRSPIGRAAAPATGKLFDSLSADQKNGVARLVAGLALQYHSRKEMLEASVVSKAVKDFLGVTGEVRLKLDTDVIPLKPHQLANCNFLEQVLPLASDLLYSKCRMRVYEGRRQGQGQVLIIVRNVLKPALFSDFVLPVIHKDNTDKACTGQAELTSCTLFYNHLISLCRRTR